MTKDTVVGIVTYKEALEGATDGLNAGAREDFELVPSEHAGYVRAKVRSELLFELLQTPAYSTWQGEIWQFCCRQPAVYVGEWKEWDFTLKAPDGDGKAYFSQATIDGMDSTWWGILDQIGGPYMFRCPACGRLLGHYDMD
jgi:uncharacterized protein CbrC (UPF0167 family)